MKKRLVTIVDAAMKLLSEDPEEFNRVMQSHKRVQDGNFEGFISIENIKEHQVNKNEVFANAKVKSTF